MYNYTEFHILESGNAAGKGGDYPPGDYCIVNFREKDNVVAEYQQKVLVCAPEARQRPIRGALSEGNARRANILNLAILFLINVLFV